MSFTDVELCGQTSDARPIDFTPFDKAHSPPDEITSVIPLGRTGRRVGAAPLARPEASLLGSSCRSEHANIRPLWPHRSGAARSAIDACRGDARDELPIESAVARHERVVTTILIES